MLPVFVSIIISRNKLKTYENFNNIVLGIESLDQTFAKIYNSHCFQITSFKDEHEHACFGDK